MPKGIRETLYHIVVLGQVNGTSPAEVIKLAKASDYHKWSRAHGLQLDPELVHTGDMYGRLSDGRNCIIVKGKTVVPGAGVYA